MPSHIVHRIHPSQVTGTEALTTSMSASVVHAHDLGTTLPAFLEQRNWRGILDCLVVQVTGSASPTTVTVRVCLDAAGDEVIVPDTTATLVTGITTATTKTASFKVDTSLWQYLSAANHTLYVFAYVDDATGSPLLSKTTLTWRE